MLISNLILWFHRTFFYAFYLMSIVYATDDLFLSPQKSHDFLGFASERSNLGWESTLINLRTYCVEIKYWILINVSFYLIAAPFFRKSLSEFKLSLFRRCFYISTSFRKFCVLKSSNWIWLPYLNPKSELCSLKTLVETCWMLVII